MAKVIKTHTLLADTQGKVWVEAQLSEAQVKRLIRLYGAVDITLTPYGSPNQVMAQLEAVNAVLDTNSNVRALKSMGKLEVIAV